MIKIELDDVTEIINKLEVINFEIKQLYKLIEGEMKIYHFEKVVIKE
jgi:hypothetical protein